MIRRTVQLSWTVKMAVLMGSIVLATVAAFAAVNCVREREVLTDNLRTKGWGIVRSIASLAAGPLAAGDQELLTQLVQNLDMDKEVAYAAVLDPAGRVVAHSDPDQVGQGKDDPTTFQALAERADRLQYYTDERGRPIVMDLVAPVRSRDGTLRGYVRLGMDVNVVRAQLYRMLIDAGMVGVAALIAGLFLTIFLTRHYLDHPVRELREATVHAGAGDFSSIEINKEWPDDLGAMAQSLNLVKMQLANMVEPLRDGLADIRRMADELLRVCEPDQENSLKAGELRPLAKRLARLTERLHSLSLQIKI